MEVILTEDDLKQKCKEWQEILSLQDWDVKPGIYRADSFKTEGSQAECDWVLKEKMAIIRILDPVDYPENKLWPQDMEISLVHELIHLHVAPFDETKAGSLQEIMMEQATDLIARALVRLIRASKRKFCEKGE